MAESGKGDDGIGPDVRVLQRWVDAGGLVRVVGRHADGVTVSMLSCTAGEEVDRLTSTDPAVPRWLATHAQAH
jgi:hypothetical protein